jgi:hypothetical protein
MSESYDLFKKIHASPGMTYLNRSKIRDFSINIFWSNYLELRKACQLVENPEVGVKLLMGDQRELGLQAHMEVMRLFHNFLAAAKSLVDHTRVFVDEHYSNSPVSDGYRDKIKTEFSEDQLARFIQDLRNYMMHRGLPGGSMSLSVKRQPDDSFTTESTVSINRDDVSTWSGWTTLSRAYLATAPEQIKISDLISSYAEKIRGFSEWLDRSIRGYHIRDIRDFQKLQRLYRDARTKESKAGA